MSASAIETFDALYRASPDPWGTRSRWYERRKRDLLMASLPRERYGSVYEAGCGTGHVSAALAPRCDRLVASDASGVAVDIAATALKSISHAIVRLQRLPEDWPSERFDLVVLGEMLYFVDGDGRDRIATLAREAVGDEGTIIACDWRHAIDGHDITGEEAHERFGVALALPRTLDYADADFVITAWSADPRSVAQREGLR